MSAPGQAHYGTYRTPDSNVHAPTPDTRIGVILHGIAEPAVPALGAMPGFGGNLDDGQVAELTRYIRAQFARGKPAWTGVAAAVSHLRARP